MAEATRCTAVDWSSDCCTTAKPCSFGKGDCDNSDECSGDLICGNDNCLRDFGFGSNGADCCIDAGKWIYKYTNSLINATFGSWKKSC